MYMRKYQREARKSKIYPSKYGREYVAFGLVSEAGEVAGKFKKHLRGDYNQKELRKKISEELGDVMWYVAMICEEFELDLERVCIDNIKKLAHRKDEGTLQGDGDDR